MCNHAHPRVCVELKVFVIGMYILYQHGIKMVMDLNIDLDT